MTEDVRRQVERYRMDVQRYGHAIGDAEYGVQPRSDPNGRWVRVEDVERLQQETAQLRGALSAQEDRERQAGERCGVPYELSGCDWPDAVAERVLALQKEVAIITLSVPLEEDLAARIDDACKYIAMGQGYTASGLARLLIDCQRRMAVDWQEVGSLRISVNRLRQETSQAEAALSALQAERQWQPIETAPKDYRVRVLIYDASWCGGPPRITATNWVGYRERNGEVIAAKGSFSGVTWPTHWMPLPAPPVLRSGDAEC